ncbi:MAG: bifunctional hydroxymethylpyrimidine kinase/phosphomethylpyrimidine kinase [Lachnospiraceae bacterium]|nr:bifunctional hydroxymethylpyrimidine kinase/phosphomethylpyrimidine kinase [Lachnospiraceae bacterium]
MTRPVTLSIAGLDPSGGAGLIADIKTFLANGVYGMGAVTCVTAQNTVKVSLVTPMTPEALEDEIMTAISDIRPDAVKVGMMGTAELIRTVRGCLSGLDAPVVLDPVMISSSGTALLKEDAIDELKKFIPEVNLLTPNYPEAEFLAGENDTDTRSREKTGKPPEQLAELIGKKYHTAVLVKGGHLSTPDDYLYDGSSVKKYPGLHIENPNTHGTGCTLSSAIAANLAKGHDLSASVRLAKEYVTTIISAGLDLGAGHGPMDHGAALRGDFTEEYC